MRPRHGVWHHRCRGCGGRCGSRKQRVAGLDVEADDFEAVWMVLEDLHFVRERGDVVAEARPELVQLLDFGRTTEVGPVGDAPRMAAANELSADESTLASVSATHVEQICVPLIGQKGLS